MLPQICSSVTDDKKMKLRFEGYPSHDSIDINCDNIKNGNSTVMRIAILFLLK